jgi:NAD(P)-dependent dehydrogenase (short-subunit alcohol dehydrogenase family)
MATHIGSTFHVAAMAVAVDVVDTEPVEAMALQAVLGITESLRDELAHTNVGVSVLCPGSMATRISESERNRPARFGPARVGERWASTQPRSHPDEVGTETAHNGDLGPHFAEGRCAVRRGGDSTTPACS